MNSGYSVRPSADRDIDHIADYLADHAGLDTALRFLAETYSAFVRIAGHPRMGRLCGLGNPQLREVRMFRVSESFRDYLIFDLPFTDHIEILRLVHGSRETEALLAGEEPN